MRCIIWVLTIFWLCSAPSFANAEDESYSIDSLTFTGPSLIPFKPDYEIDSITFTGPSLVPFKPDYEIDSLTFTGPSLIPFKPDYEIDSITFTGPSLVPFKPDYEIDSLTFTGPSLIPFKPDYEIDSLTFTGPSLIPFKPDYEIDSLTFTGPSLIPFKPDYIIDAITFNGTKPAVPAIEPPKAEMGKLPPKPAHKNMDKRITSIKLLSYKPLGGTNPFSVKDVSKLDQAPKLAAPEKQPESPTESGSPSPAPSTTPTTPDNSPPPAVVTRSVAPTGFTCSGKADGQYCKDANTQVFCYKDTEANKQNCPSGCDETNKSCNAYKP